MKKTVHENYDGTGFMKYEATNGLMEDHNRQQQPNVLNSLLVCCCLPNQLIVYPNCPQNRSVKSVTINQSVARWLRVPSKTYLRTLSRTNQQQRRRICDFAYHYESSCVRVFWHQLGTRISFDFLRVRSFLPPYFFFRAMAIGIMSILCLAK